ncbi:hypothetical protein EJ08DRAFT_269443 [Tothia fuscella]|uniref:Uncharacterized protein n=1 Tax=Tothia fuscella TaxID=1048955 RepID=A0A9P4TY65_9PEZI|nr:hypothetical protein EJ08DRAFT_269443 [Tothia fuscella]
MSSSTPSSPHLNSHSTRPRASSDITSIPPHLLHRPRTGRIQRVHSNTTRVTSIRKQEAIWEAATGLSWTRDDESHPSPESALPDSIPPLALSLPDFFTETPQSQDFPSPKALPDLGDSTSLLEPTSTAPDLEESREALWYSLKQPPYSPKAETRGTSMEFMMPPQYSQFGSYSSSYTPSGTHRSTFRPQRKH